MVLERVLLQVLVNDLVHLQGYVQVLVLVYVLLVQNLALDEALNLLQVLNALRYNHHKYYLQKIHMDLLL